MSKQGSTQTKRVIKLLFFYGTSEIDIWQNDTNILPMHIFQLGDFLFLKLFENYVSSHAQAGLPCPLPFPFFLLRGHQPQVTRLQRVILHGFSEHFQLNNATYCVQLWGTSECNLYDMLDLTTDVEIKCNSYVETGLRPTSKRLF